ncbi:ADP-glyceromanno-heptose 6-epimerase [Desulfohalobiaceae bacterium Ax17]|uniref:ADP-glyceromanno-heptose 6-epimerase n=1 Tax=Desulfovulcanus ferrireducens TaxID=2831190 RepID=UPI00207BBB68|nr:ADP-glyceromanno-heptose 6-epimerase [Desulfovulcanus ferrireducens]MBT8763025.1 ADP-glyceromanno-heptose 6-epimerase [Desulfovulcanus ferrireducens]
MYIVTGGAGFIGSAFVWQLNQMGIERILIVDNLGRTEKWKNLVNLKYLDYEHKDKFLDLVLKNKLPAITAIIHMGACSSTTELDADYLMENNFHYTQKLARYCLENNARFIYASSAATYGDGTLGFDDDHAGLANLKPLNMYGYSKHLFDLWAQKKGLLDKIVGLKFFNVFGPNEYHKGDMKSVIAKAYSQIKDTGKLKLFKSYRPEYGHGEQKRDFIYVKDCVQVMAWFLEHKEINGIFNLGTGKARSWNELARAVFVAMHREPSIEYIEMPESIRDKYQYFTQARMDKLKAAGCPCSFMSLEEAAKDYVQNYLSQDDPYLR